MKLLSFLPSQLELVMSTAPSDRQVYKDFLAKYLELNPRVSLVVLHAAGLEANSFETQFIFDNDAEQIISLSATYTFVSAAHHHLFGDLPFAPLKLDIPVGTPIMEIFN